MVLSRPESRQELYALLAVEMDTQRIAIHEAGHALHAFDPPFGKPFGVKRVEVRAQRVEHLHGQDEPCFILGQCVRKYDRAWRTLRRDRELAEAFLVQAFVGPAAEYEFTRRKNWARCKELAGDRLRQHLLFHYSQGCPKEYAQWLQARATGFVISVWPAILAVSARLVEKRKMNGRELAAIYAACF